MDVHTALTRVTNLKTEAAQLKQKIRELKELSAAKNKRLRELVGTRFDGEGEIYEANCQLEKAKLIVLDGKRTPVIWLVKPTYDGNFVVDRVTKKRIYVRQAGRGSSVDSFALDGKAIAVYNKSRIDIKATFKNGI